MKQGKLQCCPRVVQLISPKIGDTVLVVTGDQYSPETHKLEYRGFIGKFIKVDLVTDPTRTAVIDVAGVRYLVPQNRLVVKN